MADNFVANPGAGGDTFAADDVAGVKYPYSKIDIGGDGVSSPVTSANPLPVIPSATFAEDTPHSTGASGLFILAVQQTADQAIAGDGDYAPFQVDEAGRLKVSNVPGSQAAITGNITANGQQVAANVGRTSNIVIGMVATSLVGHNAAFEASVNSTNGTDGTWYSVQLIRSNANTIETSTGTLAATPAYLWEGSVNGYTWFRIRATAHTSGTAAYTIQPAPFATEPIPAAQISGTQPVSGTVTANIGTGSLAAGTNAIGDVGIQVRANATGAATAHVIQSTAGTNAANIKGSAGRVVGYCFSNNSSTNWAYVKFHNATGTPTPGAGVFFTVGIPPNGKAECSAVQGLAFSTGIGRSITGGAATADTTAIGADQVVGWIAFA